MARPRRPSKPRQAQLPPVQPLNKEAGGGQVLAYYGAHYGNPQWATSQGWRQFVMSQPVMVACREVLLQQLVAIPWLITARDPERSEELQDEIEYYSEVLNKWGGEDFDTGVERLATDTLTLPFGGAVETGAFSDGTLAWVENVDGATLYPTYDHDYPVAQRVPGGVMPDMAFPRGSIHRAYISPKPEFDRRGWGMAPPEKIYLAVQMLSQGDKFYWSFLTDTPEHGIIDLADTSQTSALKWLDHYRAMLSGVDPQKLIVTWEHQRPINFIPLKKGPADIEMMNAKGWYATLCAAGYGIPLSEIGLNGGGGSGSKPLAGEIRDDRRGRRTGFAYLISKIQNVINSILPPELQFKYENRDDEALSLLGRARSTSITAFRSAIEAGILSDEGARAQLRSDGLISEVALKGPYPKAIWEFQAESAQRMRETETANARKDATGDDNLRAPDVGGQGQVKANVERAITALFPVVKAAVSQYGVSEVLDLGRELQGLIISNEYGLIEKSGVPSADLLIAAEYLTSPCARRRIERARNPQQVRGSSTYHKIYRELEAIYAE